MTIALDHSEYDYLCAPDIAGAFGDEIDTLYTDGAEVDALDTKMTALYKSSIVAGTTGLSKSAFSILQSANLLQSTALENMGFEDVSGQMAAESLLSAASETAARWASKIVSTLGKAASFAASTIGKVWDKITGYAKQLGSATWDMTKAAGRQIKAHPYATVAAAIAAAIAVGGVIALTTGGFPAIGSTGAAISRFMTRFGDAARNIRFPGSKIYTRPIMSGKVLRAEVIVENAPKSMFANINVLGWSKAKLGSILTGVKNIHSGVMSGITSINNTFIKPVDKFLSPILRAPAKAAKFVREKTGSDAAAWATERFGGAYYYSILFKVAFNLFELVKLIVFKTLAMIRDTLRALVSLVV